MYPITHVDTNSSLNTIYQFIYSFFQVSKHQGNTDDIFKANNNISIINSPKNSPIIICVIGESFIKRHSSLYGYPLKTNPNLEKEKDKGNLFVFKDVVTPYPSTNENMKIIYSTWSSYDTVAWSSQPLFPAIFKKAGFKVALLDFQATRSRSSFMFDFHCSFFINPIKIHKQCFDFRNDSIFQHDGDGLDIYMNNLFHFPKSLNIIHLQGQHLPSEAHFPKTPKWEKFKDTDILRPDLNEKQRMQIASYDNCTFYNDAVLKRVITSFAHEDAVLVYFSDHGEQLYDDSRNVYGRTFGIFSRERIKSINEIPFIIWVSDSYRKNHPDKLKLISNAINRPFSNDDIPYLLLDLANIDFKGNKPERSVINQNFKSHDRILIEGNQKFNYDSNKEELDTIQMLIPYCK